MTYFFYMKMAIQGIKKNKKLYLPYILISVLWIMMFYIVYSMAMGETIRSIRGGGTLITIIQMGIPIIFIFSFVFLMYMNSFLTKQRNKEYALYSVLGLNKKNIFRILFWDTTIVASICISIGAILGAVLYKLFEVGLLRIVKSEYDFSLEINVKSVIFTFAAYGIIFAVILIQSLIRMAFTKLTWLLKSQNMGEKPLKANWILGLLGIGCLGVAYYLALTLEDPMETIPMFFLAVLLVCIGTYLLFIVGTVILCKILQRNKAYYYQSNHFLFVSTMAFRMRKNGAGLAAICIFITMVLVMISSTFSLYISEEELLTRRYPRDIILSLGYESINQIDENAIEDVKIYTNEETEKLSGEVQDEIYYKRIITAGQLKSDQFEFMPSNATSYEDIYQVFFLDIADYNRIYDKQISLKENEAMIHAPRGTYEGESIKVTDTLQYEVVEVLDGFWKDPIAEMTIFPSLMIVVGDLNAVEQSLQGIINSMGESIISSSLVYNYNTDLVEGDILDLQVALEDSGSALFEKNNGVHRLDSDSFENGKAEFYGLYGGLFFIGIILSVLFIAATVLIIYYKQIVEGFEDRGRFEIMKKIGMSNKEIRKGINAQVLTIFFLPLVVAGVHLSFAFPIIRQLLLLFNMTNTMLLVSATIVSFLIFGLFYVVIYYMTSRVYYQIVSR